MSPCASYMYAVSKLGSKFTLWSHMATPTKCPSNRWTLATPLGSPNINWPLLYAIIPTLFVYILVCHPYISFHSKVLLFYLGSHAVGSSCDHMHKADQFHTASNLVVDLGTTAEPAHIWGSFFQNSSGRLAALWSLLTERDNSNGLTTT